MSSHQSRRALIGWIIGACLALIVATVGITILLHTPSKGTTASETSPTRTVMQKASKRSAADRSPLPMVEAFARAYWSRDALDVSTPAKERSARAAKRRQLAAYAASSSIKWQSDFYYDKHTKVTGQLVKSTYSGEKSESDASTFVIDYDVAVTYFQEPGDVILNTGGEPEVHHQTLYVTRIHGVWKIEGEAER